MLYSGSVCQLPSAVDPNMADSPPDPDSPSLRTTDREDAALTARLQRNERDAFASLYDAYARIAFGLAYRMLGDAGEAEDVVQESFVMVWRQADRLDPSRGSVRTLLLTIVPRRSIDALRKRSNRLEKIDAVEAFASNAADPLEFASAGEERSLIRRAMEELPREQRQAIELTYFGGLTVVEMADQQGIPVGTAKSRLRLALDRLRNALAKELA